MLTEVKFCWVVVKILEFMLNRISVIWRKSSIRGMAFIVNFRVLESYLENVT